MSTAQAAASLTEQLAAAAAKFSDSLPPEIRAVFEQAAAQLIQDGIAAQAPREGEQAADFELPSNRGGSVRLSDALRNGPAVVSFYRGKWCPYCTLEARALQQALPEIRQLGATLLALSPQTQANTAAAAETFEVEYDLLSDAGSRVAQEYGLVYTLPEPLRPLYANWGIDIPASNGDDSFQLPVPATYVIDGNGTIRLAFVDTNYQQRLDPTDILACLRGLA